MNEVGVGYDDLFGDLSFPDAKIGLEGDPQGQPSDSPPDKGQPSDSPSDDQKMVTDDKQKPTEDLKSKDGDDKGKKVDDDTPFDKNPKWIKARAAEKALQEILDENDLLDIDEIKEAIASGKSLKEALADQDLESLKKDSAAYKEYKKRMEEEDPNDVDDGQVPDEKLAKALQTVKNLTNELDAIKTAAREAEADEEAFSRYTSDVNKILEISDASLDDNESILFKSVMGIDNPSTQVDIENRAEVRTMVKNSVKEFKTTLQEIKQKAIDDYAAGRSEMVVTDPKKSGDLDSPILDKKNYDPEKQTVDQVLDSGKAEMLELITQQARQVF
jgi:hypothetical protein